MGNCKNDNVKVEFLKICQKVYVKTGAVRGRTFGIIDGKFIEAYVKNPCKKIHNETLKKYWKINC